MSSLEYAELRAFARLERIGYERTDLYAGAMSLVDPEKFRFSPEENEEQSEEEIMSGLSRYLADEAEEE